MEGLISPDLKAMEEASSPKLVAYTATANRAKQALSAVIHQILVTSMIGRRITLQKWHRHNCLSIASQAEFNIKLLTVNI